MFATRGRVRIYDPARQTAQDAMAYGDRHVGETARTSAATHPARRRPSPASARPWPMPGWWWRPCRSACPRDRRPWT
ncbi:hypothetical protein [Streptomyces sp. 16-176A]|uniref:hypothetical protein n=1 Tax=Streptomyces sp. 16-176A TaxID=2530458 RepID=UPI00345D7253